jgi:hypothetical protein
VHTLYGSDNSPAAASLISFTTNFPSGLSTVPLTLDDGNIHTAYISYTPNANPIANPGKGQIVVVVDGTEVLRTHIAASPPAGTRQIDDAALNTAFGAGGVAYVGFTAASNPTQSSDTDILEWQFFSTPASAALSTAEPPTWLSNVLPANAKPVTRTFYVQARDSCSSAITLGGQNLFVQLRVRGAVATLVVA